MTKVQAKLAHTILSHEKDKKYGQNLVSIVLCASCRGARINKLLQFSNVVFGGGGKYQPMLSPSSRGKQAWAKTEMHKPTT